MKKKILLTGAFGIVGQGTLNELLNKDYYDIRVLEMENQKNKEIAKEYQDEVDIVWGDIRNLRDVKEAVKGRDCIIHVAAIIPPLADEKPELARAVNVGGTKNIIEAMEEEPQNPKLIYTSSIAIYGDRRQNPYIQVSDEPHPGEDQYARQKLECENLIKNSNLEWVICRLTYIVSMDKLDLDPLMYHMPLETCIEICHGNDVGLALTNAIESEDIWGKTLNLAGGPKCRIVYGDYIHKMLDIFGLGGDLLPKDAFSERPFHCGFMDTRESQELLEYQRYTLDEYFEDVKEKVKVSRFFIKTFQLIARPIAKKYLLDKSPFYKKNSEQVIET
ncbi:MAG: NAD-dependent epimerase/dehydratase family protein [Promethearchaeia archaeon]